MTDVALTDPAVPATAPEPLPVAVVGSLSPSRASDFKTCPLLYRFRSIDRLPETPTRAATRGTVVHAVLEHLYDLPAGERTVEQAQADVAPSWEQLLTGEPELAQLFDDDAEGAELTEWLESARQLVANYFTLEDPQRLEPAEREQLVEVVLDGLRLRGYVDRLDVSPAGDLRVVDYKTGSIPREAFEAKALFQMKFYALVLWRTRGVVPRQLRLIYLADSDTLSYQPEADELARFERTLQAIWKAIAHASMTGDFRPSPSRLCDWCSHQALCPAKGGTPPPFPAHALAAASEDRRVATPVGVRVEPEPWPVSRPN
ncbi:RecB family exonuclease [Jatrophihabitans lederbergiae]|uniref:RecB family exonuclease n=1 Tax=Jatrophihabitans lederbergiae TaxID=3075547 RepID=A0ABU2JDQ8_9ACTN|nr:RecB family exonuclease [Jatrophihabitans sp. DSM 44399]MDT0262839.1 RecB family exonuclease [Jatrophihabitans sp. DSM 44399]